MTTHLPHNLYITSLTQTVFSLKLRQLSKVSSVLQAGSPTHPLPTMAFILRFLIMCPTAHPFIINVLLIPVQVYNNRWHGCREIVPPATVHWQAIPSRPRLNNWRWIRFAADPSSARMDKTADLGYSRAREFPFDHSVLLPRGCLRLISLRHHTSRDLPAPHIMATRRHREWESRYARGDGREQIRSAHP